MSVSQSVSQVSHGFLKYNYLVSHKYSNPHGVAERPIPELVYIIVVIRRFLTVAKRHTIRYLEGTT